MRPILVKVILWTSLLLPIAGAGFLVGAAVTDDGARVADLLERNRSLTGRAQRLTERRDSLRAERDQLERRLAAKAPRAVCPDAYVSTADVDLLDWFEVEYRCGWHVMHDPAARAGTEERPGARVRLTLFSRLPLRVDGAPGTGIELADWTDDPDAGGDGLPPLDAWLRDERRAFEAAPRERTLEAADDVTVYVLDGVANVGEEKVPLLVALWESEDVATGTRHVLRAVAVDPSEQTRAAFRRLVRSFRATVPS